MKPTAPLLDYISNDARQSRNSSWRSIEDDIRTQEKTASTAILAVSVVSNRASPPTRFSRTSRNKSKSTRQRSRSLGLVLHLTHRYRNKPLLKHAHRQQKVTTNFIPEELSSFILSALFPNSCRRDSCRSSVHISVANCTFPLAPPPTGKLLLRRQPFFTASTYTSMAYLILGADDDDDDD
ncbi:unnamed protein product, partial [Ectocarpus sp. 4 AP-2014]